MIDATTSTDKQTELEATNKSIAKLEASVKDAEDMHTLFKIDVFKRVVVDELFTDEVNKLTQSLAMDPHTAESEELILVRLRSLKLLRNYLNGRKDSLASAQLALDNEQEYRQSLLNEIYGVQE